MTIRHIAHYAKAHLAFLGLLGTWLIVSLQNGSIDGQEWFGLLGVFGGTGVVAAVPNGVKPRKPVRPQKKV